MADEVLYFISDTHLGDGTAADRFRYPTQLQSLLARIEADPAAHLVLLGDFFELWASELDAVMVRHWPVFAAVGRIAATHPVTYVVGNHDCLPWYYYIGQQIGNINITERLTAGRGTLLALHGHQFDPFNRVAVKPDGDVKAPWTRKLVEAIGTVERVGGDSAADAVTRAGETLGGLAAQLRGVLERQSPGERGYPDTEQIYDQAARALMRGTIRNVVMGHTHHPLLHRYGNRVYANTGSWVWDRYPPTYGRFAGGVLEVLDANTHQPYQG